MPNQRSGNHLSVYQVMIGAFMISFSGVYVKWALVGPTMSGFYRVFLGGLILACVSIGQGESFPIPDMRTAGALTAYALFSQVLGWVLISKGLPGVPTSLAGLLLLLQPSLAFVWDMLLFDLTVTLRSSAGTILAPGRDGVSEEIP